MQKLVIFISILFIWFWDHAHAQKNQRLNLAFYNLENLFDTLDNPATDDQDFLPDGAYKWNTEKYNNKLSNLTKVIQSLTPNGAPDILGVCEVENRNVLTDLINNPGLKPSQFEIIHRDSPDERGIDVALLYQKKKLKVVEQEWINGELSGDRTREVMFVRFQNQMKKHFWLVVVHAPSRREGKEISEIKRVMLAHAILNHMKSIQNKFPDESVFIIGDFNDEPTDKSMQEYTNAGFQNAISPLKSSEVGTLKFNNEWFIFDQILYDNRKTLKVDVNSAAIFSPDWLRQHGDPKYEGSPLKTFGGKKYLNGYSDHFPVYIQIY